MNTAIPTSSAAHNNQDPSYQAFVAAINARLRSSTEKGKTPLFTTDSDDLWEAYLDAFPAEVRQYHNCHGCRQFIQRFGGLVTIDAKGAIASAIWHPDDAPERYRPAVRAMVGRLRKAKVTGVFLSSEANWGKAETGAWRHFAIKPMGALVFKRTVLTASQTRAEKTEDFKNVMFALEQFKPAHLETALSLLQTDALYRSERVLGPAKWLQALQSAQAAARGDAKQNVVWRAVATAPAGFCHPRSSMIGTLLDDIAAGMDFEEVSRRFAAKMHPLQYLRPQAPPTAGEIEAAEKLIAQLDAAGALARRFARLDEVQALWRPSPSKAPEAVVGVFGHLKAKDAKASPPAMKIPPQTMTWEKFQRTVLPTAEQIEFFVPEANQYYGALVTAVNADAPPILQWDHEERRNPVSWYVWVGGAKPKQFGLKGGQYRQVAAIAHQPSMWNGGYEHQGTSLFLLLDGAKDSRNADACLFPGMLKAEFHGVRSVIEAFSRDAKMQDVEGEAAAGLMLGKGQRWDVLIRVTSGGKTLEYKLDRWD